jgi:hypothetical protein
MTKIGIGIVALAMATGVGCKKDGGGAGGDSCTAAVNNVMTIQMAEMLKDIPADKKPFVEKMKTTMIAACKEDKWPAELVKCGAAAKDEAAFEKCGDLPEDLEKKLDTRMKPIMAEMMGMKPDDMGGDKPEPVTPDPTAKPTEPAAGGAAKFIADYAAIKDKLCACADKACADAAKAEADAHEKSGKDIKPTPEEEAAFEKIENEVNECAGKHK